MALHLTDDDVAALLSPAEALISARRAFRALGLGRVTQPPRITTEIPDHEGSHLSMPCYLSDDEGEILTMKAVTIFPGNREIGQPNVLGFLVLYNPASGQPLAFMEAEKLTLRRTAAACALATQYLARPDSEVLAIFGTGMQAAAHVEAVVRLFKLTKAKVFGPSLADVKEFCARMALAHGVEVQPSLTPSECLRGADIVCATTSSHVPVFAGADVAPGTHINAIGSFRADMAELDFETVRRSRVFVDERSAALLGAGELIQAALSGAWSWDGLAGELSDLVIERRPGRQSQDEITIFKSVGLAVQDATAAHAVYVGASGREINRDLA